MSPFNVNTQEERDAILSGYNLQGSFDENALKWCEVLNYLYFAHWWKEISPTYASFALERSLSLAGLHSA